MTQEEKQQLLDALEAAEQEALSRIRGNIEAEVAVLRLAARVRAVVLDATTTDLPGGET